jgi:hypothetical protein
MTNDGRAAGEDEAPGWRAIEAHIRRLVTAAEPLHRGTNALPDQGVYGISSYDLGDSWLLLTLGLTELFEKISEDAEVTGYGFELTLLVPHRAEETEPAFWTRNLLYKLGQYVYSSGRLFSPGHRMEPGGPITGAQDTALTGVAFAEDPLLGRLNTPFGMMTFLRVVGVTAGELRQMRETSTKSVLEQAGGWGSQLLTDPERA